MSNSDLKRNPHNIDKDTWWYEESGGIEIVHWFGKKPNDVKQIKISWKSLRNALSRKDNRS